MVSSKLSRSGPTFTKSQRQFIDGFHLCCSPWFTPAMATPDGAIQTCRMKTDEHVVAMVIPWLSQAILDHLSLVDTICISIWI